MTEIIESGPADLLSKSRAFPAGLSGARIGLFFRHPASILHHPVSLAVAARPRCAFRAAAVSTVNNSVLTNNNVLIAIVLEAAYEWCFMKQHILVVDDEAPIRELLESYFKKRGYLVSTAANGQDALRLANEDGVKLHLVILDVVLADSDGLELLGELKAAHPNLPVIIMTGIGFEEELLQEALQKGASGYVSKTLPLDQLLMEVHRTLNYRQ